MPGEASVPVVESRTCCSTSGKDDVGGFKAIGFHSPFGKPMLNSKEAGL
jgi:hypothetical protein